TIQAQVSAYAPGGTIKQSVYVDDSSAGTWDETSRTRCFVHLADSSLWKRITGEDPPTEPFSAQKYNAAGLPWFEHYDDGPALNGSETLSTLNSLGRIAKALKRKLLGGNRSITPRQVVSLGRGTGRRQVRDGS
ncbi:MAG: hypothetical protein V2B18_00595, partial [Pseudomonadota bacterium]